MLPETGRQKSPKSSLKPSSCLNYSLSSPLPYRFQRQGMAPGWRKAGEAAPRTLTCQASNQQETSSEPPNLHGSCLRNVQSYQMTLLWASADWKWTLSQAGSDSLPLGIGFRKLKTYYGKLRSALL